MELSGIGAPLRADGLAPAGHGDGDRHRGARSGAVAAGGAGRGAGGGRRGGPPRAREGRAAADLAVAWRCSTRVIALPSGSVTVANSTLSEVVSSSGAWTPRSRRAASSCLRSSTPSVSSDRPARSGSATTWITTVWGHCHSARPSIESSSAGRPTRLSYQPRAESTSATARAASTRLTGMWSS